MFRSEPFNSDTGTMPKLLTPDTIIAIRTQAASGLTAKDIADTFGLGYKTVRLIITGQSYPDVGGPLRPKRAWIRRTTPPAELREEGRRRLRDRTTVTSSGCWRWNGKRDPQGYARICLAGKQWLAHRLSYELFVGAIPVGTEIDHTCHGQDPACFAGNDCPHRGCVNPAHLAAISHEQNVRAGRGWATHGSKTHCPRNHPYDEENTRRYPGKGGGFLRQCRACGRDRSRARKQEAEGVSVDAATTSQMLP